MPRPVSSSSRKRGSSPAASAIAAVCAAEILGLAGYSIVPALLPQFIEAWSLTNAQAGWLAGIVSAGYMLGVLPLVSLTDRAPARTIFLASSALSALSCLGVALSDDLLAALGWRAVAGIALAGMYMPGLRALTDGMEGARRARVAAWYTSSFTVGTSLSFLLGRTGIVWGWQGAFILAAILGAIGVLIAWVALPKAAAGAAERPRPMLDVRAVLGNRDALVLIIGYATTIWGTAGLRQWIVVFLAFCAAGNGELAAQGWSILAIGTLIGLLGVPAGLLGNELSLRFGLRCTAMCVFLLSALVNASFGLVAELPYVAVVWLSLAAGFIVQGNFSNLTSGVLAVAAPRLLGARRSIPASDSAADLPERCCSASHSISSAAPRVSRRGWQPSPPAVPPAWWVASPQPSCCAGNHHLARLRECEAPSEMHPWSASAAN
jgi:predicted MFS family arabinose efflux permease